MAGLDSSEFKPSTVQDDPLSLFPGEQSEPPARRPVEPIVFVTAIGQPFANAPTEWVRPKQKRDWRLPSRRIVLLISMALGSAVLTAAAVRSFLTERQLDAHIRTVVRTETPILLVSRPLAPTALGALMKPRLNSRRLAPIARSSTPAVPYRGHLSIDSVPRGAIVFINQRRVGVTPLNLPRHPTGSYAVWVQREGYRRWTAGVLVPSNRATRVTAKLETMR
jgi:hypothetical protein